jgi:DNA-binding Xre family transcriptional regulator
MSIKYNKLFELLEQKGMTKNTLRVNKVIGTATLEKMRKGEGHIDDRSINSLCAFLNCQPSDIMEYVEDGSGDSAAVDGKE